MNRKAKASRSLTGREALRVMLGLGLVHAVDEIDKAAPGFGLPPFTTLLKVAPRMARMLRSLEWSDHDAMGTDKCPRCEATDKYGDGKHDKGCELAALLETIEPRPAPRARRRTRAPKS